MRQYAKTDYEGLLSTKVINLRKEVEKKRKLLVEVSKQKLELDETKNRIRIDIRNTETLERRRTCVAIETEQHLMETKHNLSQTQKEIMFLE